MANKNTKKPSCEKGKAVKPKSSLFKFKRYKKVEGGKVKKGKHPKLIVDELSTEFGFMGLTESAKRGHHNNIPLTKNPEKDNKNKAYIRDELRYDSKSNFGEILESYNLTRKDKIAILKYLERHKKKK